jgi:hypothetical protein
MGEIGNPYKIIVGTPEGKRKGWEDLGKITLKWI